MPRFHILQTRRWPEEVEAYLDGRYDVIRPDPDRALTAKELREAMAHFDAVCPTVTDRIGADVIGTVPQRVKFIANFGVGHNHIDLDACRALGIGVSNTPDVLTEATADLAIALMLMVSRRAGEGERMVRAGRWDGWSPTQMMGTALGGKTLGLIGFGRIAQAVAHKAAYGLGMRIAYHSRSRADAAVEAECGARFHAHLDALVADADVLTLHCPGGEATRHLIDRRRIALMKPQAILINTARGTIIDEHALAEALAERRIRGAGLDVYEEEPKVHPALLPLDNVVLLPHLGSATRETRVAMGMRVAANLDAFFGGGTPPDVLI